MVQVKNTFAADRVVSVESNWHDGPTVDGMLAEEPRHAEAVKMVLDSTDTMCANYFTHCGSMVGAFEGTDMMGNDKMLWNDFYVVQTDSDAGPECMAYCVDCVTEVAPL